MRENATEGIFLKCQMGPAGADVRRLDSGTSSSPDSVRLLGQSPILGMSATLLSDIHAKDGYGQIIYAVLL